MTLRTKRVNLIRFPDGGMLTCSEGATLSLLCFPAAPTPLTEWLQDDLHRAKVILGACEAAGVEVNDDDLEALQTAGQLFDLLERRVHA